MKKEKIFQLPTLSVLIFALTMAMSGNARAQVTIGADLEPQNFSVLELISGNSMGLRLPQMDSVQRNAMVAAEDFQREKNGKALGLTIFNTSTLCVETWNGAKWIEACAEEDCLPPQIVSYDPASKAELIDAYVGANESINLTVIPNGDTDNFTYQWRANSTDIDGAVSQTYTVTSSNVCSYSCSYSCVVTAKCDGTSVISDTFTVTQDGSPPPPSPFGL
ncbi:MAG: hypothetical protein LBB53_03670 [Prevotellaceae bacterium]|jgi:hypothetical protein|nr:hypothetical protein [Prevotellaceae bacterium]